MSSGLREGERGRERKYVHMLKPLCGAYAEIESQPLKRQGAVLNPAISFHLPTNPAH